MANISLMLFFCFAAFEQIEAQENTDRYSEIILRDQPVAYWDFSEAKTAKGIRSLSDEAISAKTFGKPVLGQAGPRPKGYPLFSKENLAGDFPGGKDCFQVDDPGDKSLLDFDSGDSLTIEAWVFPRKIANDQHMVIVSKGRTGNKDFEKENLNYALRLKGNDQVALVNFLFRSRDTENAASPKFHRWTSSIGFPVDSGWHHVAVTYSFGTEGSLRAYLDGQAIAGQWDMAGDTKAPPFVDNDQLWIGSGQANHTGAFNGWLDEVAIYRKSLLAEQIASRYRFDAGETNAWIAAKDLPDDRVVVKLFDGLMDRTWGFTLENPSLEFDAPSMALSQIPQKYNERGVIADRKLPVLAQAYLKRSLPKGEYSILVRSKNATRLWIDQKQVASQPFLTTNGDGHEAVPKLSEPPQANLHPVPQGHRENVFKVKIDEGTHVFRLDAIVGGRTIRPEIGEVCVAMALEDGDYAVLTPESIEPWVPTEPEWKNFVSEEKSRIQSLNQRLRFEASRSEREYWDQRHHLAQEKYLELHRSETLDKAKSIDQLCLEAYRMSSPNSDSKNAVPEGIDDYAFLRRVTLDTIGIVPSRQEIAAFIGDHSPNKRGKKIDQLLADERWADHWVGYWQDVLAENPGIVKPEQNNTGPFRWWIHESFLDNKPFDRLVTELVMMEGSKFFGGPAGFAMASQNDAPMAAKAQILTKAFLGMEMSCARCHDSPNSPFKQEELFSLAAMLQRDTLALPVSSTVPVNPDGRKPLITISLKAGDKLPPDWHLASFPKVDLPPALVRNESDTRERFAAIVTSPTNRRFARVIVNRLWHRYLGWAIVDPIDNWDLDHEPDSKLLDLLERELVLSGYDVKHVARLILGSDVYQAASQNQKEIERCKAQKVLALGPARRRLTAEQTLDSLFAVAGKPMDVEPMTLDPESRRPPEQFLHLGFPTRAWQFASTSTDRDRPALMMPAVQQVSDLLIALGWRDSRPTPLTLRDESASPLQSLILGNGLSSTRLARLSDESQFTAIALESHNVADLVQSLYQTILGRSPKQDEANLLVELLEPGFESRRIEVAKSMKSAKPVESFKRNAVSWANHLVPEATVIKLALEQEILRGDLPTERLETDWRERMEDAAWALMNSPEFMFVP